MVLMARGFGRSWRRFFRCGRNRCRGWSGLRGWYRSRSNDGSRGSLRYRQIRLNRKRLVPSSSLYFDFGRTLIICPVNRSCGDAGSKFKLQGILQQRLSIGQAKRHHSRLGARLYDVVDVQHKRAALTRAALHSHESFCWPSAKPQPIEMVTPITK